MGSLIPLTFTWVMVLDILAKTWLNFEGKNIMMQLSVPADNRMSNISYRCPQEVVLAGLPGLPEAVWVSALRRDAAR